MTTATANRTTSSKREQKMKARDARQSRINETLGFSSREERLQHDRYTSGTNGARQRPRYREGYTDGFKPMSREADTLFIRLIEAIDSAAGRESAHPKTSGQAFKFAVGDHLTIHLIEKDWRVEIIKRHDWIGHLRYTLNFLDADASFALVEGQLERLIVADPCPSWLELLTAALSLQADYYTALLGLE